MAWTQSAGRPRGSGLLSWMGLSPSRHRTPGRGPQAPSESDISDFKPHCVRSACSSGTFLASRLSRVLGPLGASGRVQGGARWDLLSYWSSVPSVTWTAGQSGRTPRPCPLLTRPLRDSLPSLDPTERGPEQFPGVEPGTPSERRAGQTPRPPRSSVLNLSRGVLGWLSCQLPNSGSDRRSPGEARSRR